MEWFNTWWYGLSFAEQVLYCIALPSSLFLLIQAVLIVIGAGGDFDTSGDVSGDIGGDVGGDMDGGTDFDGTTSGDFGVLSMFTVQGVASFLCVFGWGSIFLYRSGLNSGILFVIALVIALILGAAVMYAIARVMYQLAKLAHSGTLDVKNLLGSMGTVYLTIPPKGEGKGKVMVQTSERLVEFDAVSESESELSNNAQVRVVDILGENVLVVEKG